MALEAYVWQSTAYLRDGLNMAGVFTWIEGSNYPNPPVICTLPQPSVHTPTHTVLYAHPEAQVSTLRPLLTSYVILYRKESDYCR